MSGSFRPPALAEQDIAQQEAAARLRRLGGGSRGLQITTGATRESVVSLLS